MGNGKSPIRLTASCRWSKHPSSPDGWVMRISSCITAPAETSSAQEKCSWPPIPSAVSRRWFRPPPLAPTSPSSTIPKESIFSILFAICSARRWSINISIPSPSVRRASSGRIRTAKTALPIRKTADWFSCGRQTDSHFAVSPKTAVPPSARWSAIWKNSLPTA